MWNCFGSVVHFELNTVLTFVKWFEYHTMEGDSPLKQSWQYDCFALLESRSLGVERKNGGNLHQWLNITQRPIANKYHEGKLKSTSKGELTDLKSLRGKRVHVAVRCVSQWTNRLPNIGSWFVAFVHDPSWNTDQGVSQLCECKRYNLARVVKAIVVKCAATARLYVCAWA